MRRAGVTLIELMVSLALLGVAATLTATVAASARADDDAARACAEDLRHMRTASDALSSRVRSAGAVSLEDGALVIDGERWTVAGDVLLRDGAPVVRGIARLTAEHDESGAWRLGIVPTARAARARPPELVTRARPRAETPR